MNNQKSKILITGAAGFIGTYVARLALEEGHSIVAFDNFSTGKMQQLEKLPYSSELIKICNGDIRSDTDLQRAITGCSAVIHLAAMVSVPKSFKYPLECHAINVTGFQNLLEACRTENIKRVVYSSSSAVYGRQDRIPICESAIVSPLSPYGASKAINEIIASVYAESYGFECIGLRYFNVFGPEQNPAGDYAAVIPKWILSILSHGSIKIFGSGMTTRDFVYVEDVAKSALAAVSRPTGKAFSKLINIGSGKGVALLSLAESLKCISEQNRKRVSPVKIEFLPEREGDIPASVADITRMRNVLEITQTTDFENSLQRTFRWFADEKHAP